MSVRVPVGERAELLALSRRILEHLPNPSRARELVLAMVTILESTASDLPIAR